MILLLSSVAFQGSLQQRPYNLALSPQFILTVGGNEEQKNKSAAAQLVTLSCAN